jgi:hypothetical protein
VELNKPYNRDICLTNKIFTYLLAGNAIIFSETSAQKKFNIENNVGNIYKHDNIEELVKCINFYRDSKNLETHKAHNKHLAETKFNWELESIKLLQLIS